MKKELIETLFFILGIRPKTQPRLWRKLSRKSESELVEMINYWEDRIAAQSFDRR